MPMILFGKEKCSQVRDENTFVLACFHARTSPLLSGCCWGTHAAVDPPLLKRLSGLYGHEVIVDVNTQLIFESLRNSQGLLWSMFYVETQLWLCAG